MDHLTLLALLAATAAFMLVALGTGDALLALLERRLTAAGNAGRLEPQDSALNLGAALLAGIGVVAYIGVVLGLLHVFYAGTVAAALLLCAVLTRRRILRRVRWIHAGVRGWRRALADPIVLVGGLLALMAVVVQGLAALAPPMTWDALAYHMPQAEIVASGHVLWLNLGGHPFYGNIPKLIEVLYAEGLALGGNSLAPALHYTTLIAFLVFLFGTVTRFFGARSGIIAVLAVLAYRDLVSNATDGMIDAAVLSFEVGAVLAAAGWVEERASAHAVRAALFAGLALGAKYSAGFTVLLLAALMAAFAWRDRWPVRRARSAALGLAAVTLLAGGFWYVKNAIRLGNPTYPFYFGHAGLADAHYRGIVANVQQFGDRSLGAFLRIPERFTGLLDVPVFFSFFLAPFALLNAQRRRFVAVLLGFAALYLPYWFFIATHQVRFLMPAIVALLVSAAIGLMAIRTIPRAAAAVAVAACALLVFASAVTTTSAAGGGGHAATAVTTGLPAKIRYTLGLQSQDALLAGTFGCQYGAVAWLNKHPAPGNVVDNWSQWHDPSSSYYAHGRRFLDLVSTGSPAGDLEALRKNGVAFYYIRTSTRQRWNGTTDPGERDWMRRHEALDAQAAAHSRLVWTQGDCRLQALDGSF